MSDDPDGADARRVMNQLPIAITMGDPAGIGPELCLRLLEAGPIRDAHPLAVFGDAAILQRVAQATGLPPPLEIVSMERWSAQDMHRGHVVVDCAAVEPEAVRPGTLAAACGRAAYAYIEAAIREALAGRVAAVATAPVHKEALALAEVPYPGHTEIFAALTGAPRACMMLASDDLAVSMVTTHVAYAAVPRQLTTERILDVIELTAEAIGRLRDRAGRIAVCGLNPHAGEHGLFGDEEARVIEPAIAAARQQGIDVEGPVSPDAAFLPARRRRVDAFVCMYHDQGHIPFKMLAFDTGVNITLGLPIVRTSVDHGTAFDIAWTGRADPTSLEHAVAAAARLADAAKPHAGQ